MNDTIVKIILLLCLVTNLVSCKKEDKDAEEFYQCVNGNCQTNVNGNYASLVDCQTDCENINNLKIGDIYQGGIVFFLDGNGGGLVASPQDQSLSASWGCTGLRINGTSIDFGKGARNTELIESQCTEAEIAATFCTNYTLNGNSDWYLPSREELILMYQNIGPGDNLGLGNVGNFFERFYWSSSEFSDIGAWQLNFGDGVEDVSSKKYNFRVRAIRSLTNSSVGNTYECVNGSCQVNPNGSFSSLNECQNNCDACNGQSVFTDPRDGQTYDLVQIGSQCWFAENLNYETSTSKCIDCNQYGRLYKWRPALSICPNGWHLPDEEEWNELINYLGGGNLAGGKMKTTTGWDAPNADATNSSGFSGLPGGCFNCQTTITGSVGVVGKSGLWWSATEFFSGEAKAFSLSHTYGTIGNWNIDIDDYLSCRCIKD